MGGAEREFFGCWFFGCRFFGVWVFLVRAEWRSGVKGAERRFFQGCNLNCLKFNFYKLKGSKRNTENSNSTLDN